MSVAVAGASYDVVVGPSILQDSATLLPELAGAEQAFVVADPTVAEAFLDEFTDGLRPLGLRVVHLGVPAGEEAKTHHTGMGLHRQLATQEAHRDDVVVALGGGSVGDVAGFVAATYMRGVRLIQVP
ncbi:MAG TPA: iron-containing alcohol dehydrogenase, partial [Actinomycetota bacterium]|nr:iron-containing alcohol dehydrogenase [Actinomycetota bacterium]